jgi:hypothetical protein
MSNNTIFTATNLGILSGTRTLTDFVGTNDDFDFYTFDLTQNSDLNLIFDSESALTVSLIADLNNNGVVDSGETVFSSSTFSGNTVSRFVSLPNDTYVIQVERAFSNSANYDLTLIETSRPGTVATDPGNTIGDALDLGSITGSIQLNDYVGVLDEFDFYQFTLDRNSDVSISVQGIQSSSTNFSISLIADLNSNGIVDSGETIVGGGVGSGGRTFNAPLPDGSYLTVISPFFSSQSFQYEKTLTVTPTPGNVGTDPGDTLNTAFNLGILSGNRTFREYVGSLDEIDVYQFRLTEKSDVSFTFTGSSPGNRGVRASLIADLNNNGVIDNGETIESAGGINNNFSENLTSGTYFVVLSEFLEPTQYNLRLSQTPDRSGNDILRGTARRDRILGQAGNDRIFGFGGNDVLNGGIGDDLLVGAFGRDRLIGSSGNDTLRGGADRDILLGGFGNDGLFGDAGNDIVNGGGGNDRVFGGSGNDTLIGSAGNDRLDGQSGNDTIRGGAGRDILIGGTGNDRLDGEVGNDIIITGRGRDQVVLRRGRGFDRVRDFQNGFDRIDLVGINFNQLTLQRQNNDVLIKLGRSNIMLIEDTRLATINRADFV